MRVMMGRFLTRLDAGSRPLLVGLGDSLTFGWMVHRGYLHMVAEDLRARRSDAPPVVRNEGVCGDTAAGGRRRLSRLLEREVPDLLLIQFGLNDCFMGVRPEGFRRDLDGMIGALQTAAPDSEVVLVPPPPLAFPADHRAAEPFRSAMQDAAGTSGIALAQVAAHWRQEVAQAWLADGVHPSEIGYRWIADAVLAAPAPGG